MRDMLVVGVGGGVALEGVPASVASVDAVELEPEVIEANRLVSSMRDVDPLADPRINIVINDARNALRLTRKSYDAIVSQPSHPWTAGASHLFTREFAADVRSHLNEGGVFLQWMNGEFVDEPLLRTLAATLLAEFQHVRLYRPSLRVRCCSWRRTRRSMWSLSLPARAGRSADDVMHFSRFGIISVEDLLASLAMDEQGILSFARGAEISTDDNNLMATRSRFRADGLTAEDMQELFEPYDPLLRAGSWVHPQLGGAIDYGYLARRLVGIGQAPRATALAAAIPDFSRQFEVYGLMFEATGQGDQAPESFANALVANPLNLQARYASIRGYLDVLSRGEAPEDIQQIAAALSGPAAAAIRGLAYESAAEWASLAALDGELAESLVTDAWYPEVVRLRAAWRVNRGRRPGAPGSRGAGTHRAGSDCRVQRKSPHDAGRGRRDARRRQSAGGILAVPRRSDQQLPDRIRQRAIHYFCRTARAGPRKPHVDRRQHCRRPGRRGPATSRGGARQREYPHPVRRRLFAVGTAHRKKPAARLLGPPACSFELSVRD